MRFIQKRLLFLYFLLLPVQLNLFFWPSWAFVYGSRIDYLSPALYFTDFLFLLLLIISLFKNQIRLRWSCAVLGLFFFVNIVFSIQSPIALYKSLRILQVILLFEIIKKNWDFHSQMRLALLLAAFWASVLAILQVTKAGNLGGVLYWLGERPLNLQKPGIAKLFFLNRSLLRPYSTFGHPNSLSGFLGAVLLISSSLKTKGKYIFVSAIFVALLLGFSQSVWLALFLVLVFKKINNRFGVDKFNFVRLGVVFTPFLISFFLGFLGLYFYENLATHQTLVRRAFLNLAGLSLWSQHFWFGAGFGNFIVALPQLFSALSPFLNKDVYWWLQPVHNIYILILAETGIAGAIMVFILLWRLVSPKKLSFALIFVLLTGLFDHYWLTSHQNLMLLAFVAASTIKSNEIDNTL